MSSDLDLATVREAAERIRGRVLRTPLMRYRATDELELLLKPEGLQATGAFKIRGAFNKILSLAPDCPGIVAHSSGNHAQAVARAARVCGMRAVVVMPDDAPTIKVLRTKADGAEIVRVGPDSNERAARAREIAQSEGLVPVEPYDDPLVAAGQGTAVLEMLEDADALDRYYAPIGGGGLMAGSATVLQALSPQTEVIGCEPDDADDTRRSLAAGERVAVPPPQTLADGLRVRVPGAFTFPIVQRSVARIETVCDDELLDAMAFALSELRLVLEPSGAASLALALREGRGRCGVLLSGGNVDPKLLAEVAARSAAR